jgi:hypothetical protein
MTGAAFSCGNQQLDSYLQKQAGQDLKKRAAVAFVITPDYKTIAGFYTLSQYAVDVGELPEDVSKRLHCIVPCNRMSRLLPRQLS